MSNIDKRAREKLQAAAEKAVDNFDPNMFVETRDVLGLLDELDKWKQESSAWQAVAEKQLALATNAEQKIAELESSGIHTKFWCGGMDEFTKQGIIEDLKASMQNASGMFEISEDTICALMSMLTSTAPQLPQPAVLSVSEGVLKSLLPDVEKSEFWFEHNGKIFFEGVRFNNAVFEACRAAMLQSGNHTEQHLDMVNSQVIPDDVSRMDWLVSKTVDVREPMAYGSHSLFWSQTITDEEDDYHATKLREQIDAAMAVEQAAEPQQEVK